MICDLYLWFDLWFAHHCELAKWREDDPVGVANSIYSPRSVRPWSRNWWREYAILIVEPAWLQVQVDPACKTALVGKDANYSMGHFEG